MYLIDNWSLVFSLLTLRLFWSLILAYPSKVVLGFKIFVSFLLLTLLSNEKIYNKQKMHRYCCKGSHMDRWACLSSRDLSFLGSVLQKGDSYYWFKSHKKWIPYKSTKVGKSAQKAGDFGENRSLLWPLCSQLHTDRFLFVTSVALWCTLCNKAGIQEDCVLVLISLCSGDFLRLFIKWL